MRKKIYAVMLVLLCLVISLLLLVACADKPDESTTDIDKEEIYEQKQRVDVELNTWNYAQYLEIQHNMVSQTSTLKYNTYLVTYTGGWVGRTYTQYVNGLTPPTGSNVVKCVYISSRYIVLTTISVSVKAKSTDYNFSDVYLKFWSAPALGSIVVVKLELSNEGVGSKTFNMVDELDSPYISYPLSSTMSEIKGIVSYYETTN